MTHPSFAGRITWGLPSTSTTTRRRSYLTALTYSSGQYHVVAWGCGQSYTISTSSVNVCSASPGGFFCFQQWSSDAGTFGNPTSLSTTFYPGAASFGSITLVVEQSGLTNNWGGYLTFPASYPTTFTTSGEFVLPTTSEITYVRPPSGGNDYVMAWVGIGGCAPSVPQCAPSNLWQAGVTMEVQAGNVISFHGFYEEVKSDNSCCSNVPVGSTINAGDTISISVSTTPSSASVAYTLQDLGGPVNPNNKWTSSGGCTALFKCISGFVPDTSSEEWILEAPLDDGSQNCGTGGANHQCVMPNYASFSIPSNSMSLTGFTGWDMAFMRMLGHDAIPNFTNPSFLQCGVGAGSYSDVWSPFQQW